MLFDGRGSARRVWVTTQLSLPPLCRAGLGAPHRLCSPAPRNPTRQKLVERELQRGSLTWMDTRTWRESTTCSPCSLPRSLATRVESEPRGGGRTVNHHATSPPLTSHHARPLASARHPSQRQPRSFQPRSVSLRRSGRCCCGSVG
jgi:hypothetical protein